MSRRNNLQRRAAQFEFDKRREKGLEIKKEEKFKKKIEVLTLSVSPHVLQFEVLACT